MKITLEYKLEDMWVGAYWRHDNTYQRTYLWICLIPCFPICMTWDTTLREVKRLSTQIQKARKILSTQDKGAVNKPEGLRGWILKLK